MKEEMIYMLVKVKVRYPKGKRTETIKQAKRCVTSSSILGSTSVNPISAKEHKPIPNIN